MSEIYRFAGLEPDTSRFQVRRNGKALAVQLQVFDMLRYLVAHHDRIVSRDGLLDKIWNRRFVSEATLVEGERIEAATAVADRLLRMKPGYSLAFAQQDFFFMQAPQFVARYLRNLARTGIPA